MSFYSKTKQNKFEELTKIEQKRYEELMANSRLSHKNIISTIKASFNKGKISAPAEERKEEKPENPNSKPVTPETYSEQSSEIQSNAVKERKLTGIKSGEAKTRKVLPNLKNVPKKKVLKKEDEFKTQLSELEKQEKEIQNDIEKIDLNNYKQRIFDNLQAISEDYREMEESLKSYKFRPDPPKNSERVDLAGVPFEKIAVPEMPKNKEIEENPRSSFSEVKVKQFVRTSSEVIEEESVKEKKSSKKYAKKGGKEQSVPDRKKGVDMMRKSQCSDFSKKSGFSKKTEGSQETLAKDYVRVNPKIDIKKLLYS